MENRTKRFLAVVLAFLLALGTVPIYAADASPMEVTFVNAPNEAEMADEAASPSDLPHIETQTTSPAALALRN